VKVLKPNLIVLEATGGFESVVVAALAGAGLPVAVANPAQIRAFAKAIGQRAKTDPIDVHKETVVACVRLVIDGSASDGCLLEAGVAYLERWRLRAGAGQCRPYQERARPQERCQRCRLDL
jgi:hypothetical protein